MSEDEYWPSDLEIYESRLRAWRDEERTNANYMAVYASRALALLESKIERIKRSAQALVPND